MATKKTATKTAKAPEKSHEFTDRLRAAAIAWAESGKDGSFLLPDTAAYSAVLYEVSEGRLGEKPPAGDRSRYVKGANFMKTEAGRRLAELFLEETKVSAQAVASEYDVATQHIGEDAPEHLGRLLAWMIYRMGPTWTETLAVHTAYAVVEIARKDAEDRAAKAEKQLAAIKRPPLRQGTAALRAMLKTDVHVTQARRRGHMAGRELTPQQAEARKLFRYDPLGWSERLVVHGLASLAREQGLLDAHPWAQRPQAGQRQDRIRIAFPGITELARMIGFEPDADGKIDRQTRRTVERALIDLSQKARWIAVPVLLPPKGAKGKWSEDIEVSQTLWIEASTTLMERGVYLNLHPAAVASHMRSFINIPNLAAKYESARLALGMRQMRDELAICDDYMRSLALAQIVSRKRAAEGSAAAFSVKKVNHETLLKTLDLEAFAKKNGQKPAAERVEQALQFCIEVGSLLSYERAEHGWLLQLPHPDAELDEQLVLSVFEPTDPTIETSADALEGLPIAVVEVGTG